MEKPFDEITQTDVPNDTIASIFDQTQEIAVSHLEFNIQENTTESQDCVETDLMTKEAEVSLHKMETILPAKNELKEASRKALRALIFLVCAGVFLAVYFLFIADVQKRTALSPLQPVAVPVVSSTVAVQGGELGVPLIVYKEPASNETKTVYLPPLTSPTAMYAFLDIKTMPVSAKIYLGEKYLGETPLQKNIVVEPAESYALSAVFDLPVLGDAHTQTIQVAMDLGSHRLAAVIQAPIGILNLQRLPKGSVATLKGVYEQGDGVKSVEIVSGLEPGHQVSLPYGDYAMTLTRPSAEDPNQVIYRSDISLSVTHEVISLDVKEDDLSQMSLALVTLPAGAAVVWRGQVLGYTPYSGRLPVGDQEVALSLDGYITENLTLSSAFSTSFDRKVELAARTAETLLVKAQEKLSQMDASAAQIWLKEALAVATEPQTVAQIHYQLGHIALADKNHAEAKTHFSKISGTDTMGVSARLGLIEAMTGLGHRGEALTALMTLMTDFSQNASDDVRAKATELFKNLSPERSVVFVKTAQPSVYVIINDRKLTQTAPFLLADLKEGDYQITLKKSGFDVYETRQRVKAGEFVTLDVDLKPLN
jgi:hypothetical protein